MPRMLLSLGETGCQAKRIEVELVLCPVMLVGATRGTGKEHETVIQGVLMKGKRYNNLRFAGWPISEF